MAKGGRPRKDEGDHGTRQVRVFEDIAEMVSWIVRVEGGTTAKVIDPLVRAQLTVRYLKHKDVIDKIKKAEDEARRVEEEAISEGEKKRSQKKQPE